LGKLQVNRAEKEPFRHRKTKSVDEQFYSDLVNKTGTNEWTASAFFAAVRIGGKEVLGPSFLWGIEKPHQPSLISL
jgi:hypothetical protein